MDCGVLHSVAAKGHSHEKTGTLDVERIADQSDAAYRRASRAAQRHGVVWNRNRPASMDVNVNPNLRCPISGGGKLPATQSVICSRSRAFSRNVIFGFSRRSRSRSFCRSRMNSSAAANRLFSTIAACVTR